MSASKKKVDDSLSRTRAPYRCDRPGLHPAVIVSIFSPGDDCLHALYEPCRGARATLDVYVVTVADGRLSNEILACHQRGIAVLVITDNDKRDDSGSDVARLHDHDIAVRVDDTSNHMHHKFALVDGRTLANGSFNWTRSASQYNQENLVVTDDVTLVAAFMQRFERLWAQYAWVGRSARTVREATTCA